MNKILTEVSQQVIWRLTTLFKVNNISMKLKKYIRDVLCVFPINGLQLQENNSRKQLVPLTNHSF